VIIFFIDASLKVRMIPKFNWYIFVQRYISDKTFMKVTVIFRRYEPNCGKKMPFCSVAEYVVAS